MEFPAEFEPAVFPFSFSFFCPPSSGAFIAWVSNVEIRQNESEYHSLIYSLLFGPEPLLRGIWWNHPIGKTAGIVRLIGRGAQCNKPGMTLQ